MGVAGSIAVIFGDGAVGDDENLHELIKSISGPERISLIAVDLVECILDAHTPTFQFDMDERQPVYEDRHIVAVIVCATLRHILVYDLQVIIMDILFINNGDVRYRAVLADYCLAVALLNGACLLHNAVVGVAEVFGKERFPFVVGKPYIVESFNLTA